MHACIAISLMNFFFYFFFLHGLTLLSLLHMAMFQCAVVPHACGTMTDKIYANTSGSQVLRDQPILPAHTVFAGTDYVCW